MRPKMLRNLVLLLVLSPHPIHSLYQPRLLLKLDLHQRSRKSN